MAETTGASTNSHFKVVMQDYEGGIFTSCEGIEAELEVNYISEGGRGLTPRAVRGNPKVSKLTFSKGTVSSKGGKKTLFDWFMEVCDTSKPLKRQTLTIQLLNPEKKAIRTWKVLDAWPCRWVGPFLSTDNADISVEYVSFAHEGITH